MVCANVIKDLLEHFVNNIFALIIALIMVFVIQIMVSANANKDFKVLTVVLFYVLKIVTIMEFVI
jgi:uncharacterized membrane protein